MSRAHGLVVAVVDPGTLVGRDVKAVLEERAFPARTLHLFHSREGSDGFLARDDDEAAFVAPLTPDALETCDVAFLCGAAAGSARVLASRTEHRCLVIDLSGLRSGGAFATADAPLPPGDVLLTRDPTALVLARAASLLSPLGDVRQVTAAVDRPASELGKEALDELFQQAIALAAFRSVPKARLGAQLAFNALHPADTVAWEAVVREDFAALTRGEIRLTLLSDRAGVFHGHLLRLAVRFGEAAPAAAEARKALLAEGTGIVAGAKLSGPVETAGRDEIHLLRLDVEGDTARLALAFDHLRWPSSLQAVRLAERAVAERGLLPDA